MVKLIVFDLDGTLAPVGKSILDENVSLLKKLEEIGVRIAISSGKTLYYLIGMFRQVGLRSPILIGENGNIIAYGIDLPPKLLGSVKPCNGYYAVKDKILGDIYEKFVGKFWLQPNEVMLTIFFKDNSTRDGLREYFSLLNCKEIVIYEHVDSFDIVPAGIDKRTSLDALGKDLKITCEEMMAVGDGLNDLPMIEYCKYSIGIGNLDKTLTQYHFDDIGVAMKFIFKMVSES